ncbi:LysE family translocator [Alteromonadaceae bacterium BrNp21-10]|nr:LysE family translocator [Alteromonadaceae bacterium BrNp21-10]
MDNYLIYTGVALATILLPGPAVVLTLNNAMQRGVPKSFAGILGISLAILFVAIISATSIGVLLASSLIAFTAVKVLGAIYLIYLGIKMFRSEGAVSKSSNLQDATFRHCFLEGFIVSISNPKAVIFFMSIFPQFIDTTQNYIPQFALLAGTFSALVLVVHTVYAMFAYLAKTKLSLEKGSSILGKVSGSVFVCFGVGLAATSR